MAIERDIQTNIYLRQLEYHKKFQKCLEIELLQQIEYKFDKTIELLKINLRYEELYGLALSDTEKNEMKELIFTRKIVESQIKGVVQRIKIYQKEIKKYQQQINHFSLLLSDLKFIPYKDKNNNIIYELTD